MEQITYPDQLLSLVKEQWAGDVWKHHTQKVLPPDHHLQTLIDIAFHASLHSEEGRPLNFRIGYCEPDELGRSHSPLRRDIPMPLMNPRRLSVVEVVRLAPAADPHQLLMGVHLNAEEQLEIWGFIDSGLYWWEYERGERYRFLIGLPPDCLTVSSFQRGSLTISRGGTILIQLKQGRLIPPMSSNFSGDAFGGFIDHICGQLHEEALAKSSADEAAPQHFDEEYTRRFMLAFLQRILWRIEAAQHGGTILIIPHDWYPDDLRLQQQIRVKYLLGDERTWPLLVDSLYLHSKYNNLQNQTVLPASPRAVQALRQAYDDNADLIRDRVSLIASLATIDGAVILDKKLRLIGFGAELLPQAADLQEVLTPNSDTDRKPIDNFGTRHRSALRFCYTHEGVFAFIVSQDGNINIALKVGNDAIMRSAENLINNQGIFA